jgi:uncharacterized protein (TIGR00252 family)
MKILEVLTGKRKTGNKGEKIAAKELKKSGYKIIARNYVANNSEIDIIAENKITVIFVEVKTRTLGYDNRREPRPASSVTPEKQRKIISAAKYYLGGRNSDKRIRLDVIEVYLNKDGTKNKVVHIENAFNANTAYERKAIHQ